MDDDDEDGCLCADGGGCDGDGLPKMTDVA
jgi:hypothetical protein